MAISISISITQNSQSVESNTSNVTVAVKATWTGGSYNKLEKSGWLRIDGTLYNFTSPFNTGQTTSGSQTLFSKTVNITHNNNGSKTLACSASYTSGVSSGTVTATASKVLTTVTRKSTLSASNGTLGTSQTLSVDRQSTSLTHTITYKCGTASGTICTKSTSTSITFTPPLSLANQNTSGTTVSVVFTITTYSGSTSLGSNTKTISCSIPSSVKPTVSFTLEDAMGYSGTYGGYIQGKSKFKVVVTASGSYGSTIKAYKTTADGKSYTASSFTTSVIENAGTLTVSVTVTDSRGRTVTASKTVTVLEYEKPKISALSMKRCNSDGSSNASGDYLAITFSATIASLNGKNTAAYSLQYKKSAATSYSTVTISNYAGAYLVTNGVYIFAAEKSSSYDIILVAKDAFGSTNKTSSGSSVNKVFSFLRKGLGVAFGKVAEIENLFDVNMPARFRKGITADCEWHELTIDPDFSIYNDDVINTPVYQRCGSLVTVKGCVSPLVGYESSNTKVIMVSGIPEEIRPAHTQTFICQGSGMNRWSCSIEPDGTVRIARYGITAADVVPNTAWLVFNVTYAI